MKNMQTKEAKKESVKLKVGDHFFSMGQVFFVTSVKGNKITAKLFQGKKDKC